MALVPVARDRASAAFFDGTRLGELRLPRRRDTGEYLSPHTPIAPDDDVEQVAASGAGRVVSWSAVHHKLPDGGSFRLVVGIVELDEGPWWWTRLDEVDGEADLTDMRVQVAFEPSGPEPEHEVVPYFRPARG
ncbi:Zn-ribbon domain-containing OB-fold protein [Saccharopolyspora dendranthemae]|uniref:Putative OB-fold protein n=1 Tax=Saccharopolyspora dendranthemae TaxID=1181886 RepID=A0A561U9M8_9PSEU|nr:OB-fold domain-containing protein [Saccharopolyspora dendranthemae]TWF96069.1 putative OB-fold protein [Saccharopolyspora dendranthemae]